MPAKAGIQSVINLNNFKNLDSRLRGNDGISPNCDTVSDGGGRGWGCFRIFFHIFRGARGDLKICCHFAHINSAKRLRQQTACLPPFTFQKTQGDWILRSPRRGTGRAPRFAKSRGGGFSTERSGAQAFRLSLRKPFGFAEESGNPGRCFRKSRRHPRAQSKFSPQRKISKVNQGGKAEKSIDMDSFVL